MTAQLLTRTVYTHARAHRFDSDIAPQCPSCGTIDDLEHRLHACDVDSTPVAAGSGYIPRLRPAVDWKFPIDHVPMYLRIHVCGPSVVIDRSYDPLPISGLSLIFTDGSCKQPYTPNALSAGAAVTLVSGPPLNGTYHAVGVITAPPLAHTSFCGEATGLQLAFELFAPARREGHTVVVYCDKAASVTGIQRLCARQTVSWRSRWDGLWAQLLQAHDGWLSLDLRKVKAHQALTPQLAPEVAALIVGNMIADKVANKLVDYFCPRGLPSAADDRRSATGSLTEHVERLLRVRQSVPPVPRPARYVRFARSRAKLAVSHPHVFTWSSSGARCTNCYKLFRSRSGKDSACTRVPAASVGQFAAAKGHRHNLAVFAVAGRSAGLLLACLRCACTVGTRGAFLRRLLLGRHPTDASSFVQHVLRPWPRANRSQLALFAIPPSYLAGNAARPPGPVPSASSAASSAGPSPELPVVASVGAPPPSPPLAAEEWSLDQLSDWFGDSGF
jgi:hypothetical protein